MKVRALLYIFAKEVASMDIVFSGDTVVFVVIVMLSDNSVAIIHEVCVYETGISANGLYIFNNNAASDAVYFILCTWCIPRLPKK